MNGVGWIVDTFGVRVLNCVSADFLFSFVVMTQAAPSMCVILSLRRQHRRNVLASPKFHDAVRFNSHRTRRPAL